MRKFLLCAVSASILVTNSSTVFAHDKGTIEHKNKYLRATVIKLYHKERAPGCNLVTGKCKKFPNASNQKIHRYFEVMRRMIISKQAASYLEATRPYIAPANTMTPRVTGAPLDAIRQCESTNNYSAVSPDGKYRGGYQFDYRTWQSVGGSGDPAAASPAEQDKRAAILYARRGSSPWPVCG